MTVGGHTVAAFQWDSHLLIHLVGAAVIFFFSLVNCLAQVFIDYKTGAKGFGRWARILNTAITFCALGSMGGVGLLIIKYSIEEFPKEYMFLMAVLELTFFASSLNV